MRFSPTNLTAPSLIFSFIVGVCLLLSAGTRPNLYAQETPQPAAVAALNMPADTARGVEFYKQGNYPAAIEVLRGAVKGRKDDAQAWLHLGIALTRAGENKDARKAFEKAIKLRPEQVEAHVGMALLFTAANKLRDAEREAARAVSLDSGNAEAHYVLGLVRLRQGFPAKALTEANAALQFNPNFSGALLLKKDALLESYAAASIARAEKYRKLKQPAPTLSPEEHDAVNNLLKEAAESVDKFLKLFPTSPDAASLREQAQTLRFHSDSEVQTAALIYKSDAVTTKAHILFKSPPRYTDEARQKGIEGTIRLRIVLSSDGQVRHILVVKGLGGGLTQTALEAARGIKFTPATKDGRPVSQFVIVEYNFDIY